MISNYFLLCNLRSQLWLQIIFEYAIWKYMILNFKSWFQFFLKCETWCIDLYFIKKNKIKDLSIHIYKKDHG